VPLIKSTYSKDIENNSVVFRSRFFPSDYIAILNTLVVLKEYGYSFSAFISEKVGTYINDDDYIRKILYSLYLLTYYDVKQPKNEDLSNFKSN